VELPKVDKYSFEKIKSKNFKKGTDLRLEMDEGVEDRIVCGGGGVDRVAGQR
jgi:hypothetical protein